MSNFAFGHNVFKNRLLLLRQNASTGGKGLIHGSVKTVLVQISFVLDLYPFEP